jgi:hypothetical protein
MAESKILECIDFSDLISGHIRSPITIPIIVSEKSCGPADVATVMTPATAPTSIVTEFELLELI